MGIRDYLSDLTRSGAIRSAIGRAFRQRRRRGDVTVRVLVVVEDGSSRKDIVATLDRAGYAVTVARGAQHALEICGSRDLDVVLADPALTDREGKSFLSVLRRRRPELTTVAVVPGPSAPGGEAASVAEANATLSAPVAAAELIDTIERVLGAT